MSEARIKVLGVHAGGGIGGAPVSLVQLLAGLPRDEFEPTVAFTEAGDMLEVAASHGLRGMVVRAPAAFFYSAHAALDPRTLAPLVVHFRSSVLAAERLLESERPDIVHLNTSVLLPFGVAARRLGVPVVWHVREVLGGNPWLRSWHARFICRHADVVVATSAAVKDCLVCAQNAEVVPNAVDLRHYRLELLQRRDEIRAGLAVPPGARVIAILGSVQRVKGHWLVLDAMQRLAASLPDVLVLLVAGGVSQAYARSWKGRLKRLLGVPLDNLDALRRDVRRRGLDAHFRPIGFRADIPEILAASDALVFPSLRPEGFGRPLIEAMAMARPVVATDLGPTREIVEHEVSALLVPPGSSDALAQALTRVLTDPLLAARLGKAGRDRVQERFDLPQQVDRMAQIYRRTLTHRAPRGPRPTF